MKILITVHGFPPTHSDGAEREAERAARWLLTQGHHVEVLAPENLDSPEFRIETRDQDGLIVHRLYFPICQGDFQRNLYDNPLIGKAVADLLEANHFDLVHVFSGYLLAGQVIHTARAAKLPVMITLMEYWFLCARINLIQANNALCSGPDTPQKCARCLQSDKRRFSLPERLAPPLMEAFWSLAQNTPWMASESARVEHRQETLHAALNAADLVIAPSLALVSKFAEYGYDTSRFVRLRQGLPSMAQRPPHALRTDTLRIGYLGQMKYHKGVDLLIDAVTALIEEGHPVSLDLWGNETQEPAYVEQLRRRAADMPERICWNGQFTGDRVWEVLSGLDVLVVPSRWYENSPNVILEAFAMGVPVIATRLGGMAEMVQHESNGLLFDLNDSRELKRQIMRLISEQGLLDRLRAGIPPVATIDDYMRQVMAEYEKRVPQSASV